MLEGILLGIFGNAISFLIHEAVSNFVYDKDDDLNKSIYDCLESATKEFFNKYGSVYQNPHDTFIARKKNIQLIVKSFFYGSDAKLLNDLDRTGFNNEPNVKEEHINDFVAILNRIAKEDFLLNKIITEKKHIQESKEAHENIKKILEVVECQPAELNKENKNNWGFIDASTGESFPYQEGEKHYKKFQNGVEMIYMVLENTIFIDFKDDKGRWYYYEVDMENSEVTNIKFPNHISDYKLVVNEDDVINRETVPLPNGKSQEILKLKWNRTASVIYDKDNKIKHLEVNGDWSILHNEKIINPSN